MFSGGLAFLNKEDNDFDHFLVGAASNEKSNLADIFEVDESDKPDEINPTLKYIPPKSKQPQITTDKPTWNVVIAKIVGAFKLVNDANTSLGQLGLALLKNSSDDMSKLILYKTKEQILSTLLLTKSSQVYWKPPYLQYHDDSNTFWSLLFGCDDDSIEFFAKLEEACTIDRGLLKPDANETTEKEKERERELDVQNKVSDTDELKSKSNDKVDGAISLPKARAKSDVVYRVAKIGHQLPRMKPVADEDSDSTSYPSDTEKIPNMLPIKSLYNIPEKPGPIAPTQIPPKPANISVALQPSFWSQPSSSTSSSTFDLNTFAAENRIQHTEVRMNISKLDSKLDRVLDNIERLRLNSLNPADAPDKEEEIIKLEEKVLELKKENRLLKLQLTESDHAKKDTNEKENEVLLALQQSNDEKELKIIELTAKLDEVEHNLNADIEAKKEENAALTEKYTTEIGGLREELEKKQAELDEVQQQLLQQQQQQQQQQLQQQELPSSTKTGNASNGEMVRGIMNQFYVKLYQSIEGKDMTSMTSAELLKLTAEIIRKETKAALNSN